MRVQYDHLTPPPTSPSLSSPSLSSPSLSLSSPSLSSLRSLAYSILADLVHHIRAQLSLNQLSMAVQLFSKNVHDDTIPVSIQMMSCKLLLNLVECIRVKSEQDTGARELLMKMMEVFVLKFQAIAVYQIPELFKQCQPSSEAGVSPNMEAPPTSSTPNGEGVKKGSSPVPSASGDGLGRRGGGEVEGKGRGGGEGGEKRLINGRWLHLTLLILLQQLALWC